MDSFLSLVEEGAFEIPLNVDSPVQEPTLGKRKIYSPKGPPPKKRGVEEEEAKADNAVLEIPIKTCDDGVEDDGVKDDDMSEVTSEGEEFLAQAAAASAGSASGSASSSSGAPGSWHPWSIRPDEGRRAYDLTDEELQQLRLEQRLAEKGGVKWKDRGPPGPSADGPMAWRGQRWRHGSQRFSNRGGKYKKLYQELARAGQLAKKGEGKGAGKTTQSKSGKEKERSQRDFDEL